MTRNELQNELKKLGFKRLCNDNKTLVAYNSIQYFLYANKTPLKEIEKIYLEENGRIRAIVSGYDFEIGYTIEDENI